jgi:hypothetical protein
MLTDFHQSHPPPAFGKFRAGAGEGLGEDGLPQALGVLLGLLPQAPCLPDPAHQLLNPRHDAALLGKGWEGDESIKHDLGFQPLSAPSGTCYVGANLVKESAR